MPRPRVEGAAAWARLVLVARAVGINHVALEVGDVDEALALYGRLFHFELRGRAAGGRMAFIDLGDQFLAVQSPRTQPQDESRHFGLVVDDREQVRAAVRAEGLREVHAVRGGLAFLDPWGNHFEVVDYRNVQFERTPAVKRALGIESVSKTEEALRELADKNLS
jgi:catechol 2,3-dioxygenase-like lactoylglutathione lyase family enzyme